VGLLLQAATPPAFIGEDHQGPLKSQTLMVEEGCRQLLSTAYLPSHLQHGLEWEQVLVRWTEQVWPKADGQVAGGHPTGGGIVADVLEEGQQLLEEEEIGCR